MVCEDVGSSLHDTMLVMNESLSNDPTFHRIQTLRTTNVSLSSHVLLPHQQHNRQQSRTRAVYYRCVKVPACCTIRPGMLPLLLLAVSLLRTQCPIILLSATSMTHTAFPPILSLAVSICISLCLSHYFFSPLIPRVCVHGGRWSSVPTFRRKRDTYQGDTQTKNSIT